MVQIDIKGDVVSDDLGMFYSWFGMTAAYPAAVSESLASIADGEEIIVNVASNGGDVFAASEIYTMLRSHPSNVTVNIQGLAASAASVIAMSGNQVKISPTAQIMIHQASIATYGNHDELAQQVNVLKGIDQSIANAYSNKTGLDEGALLNLMAKETWLTAQDAVNQGFADEIMFVDEKTPQITNATAPIVTKSAVNKLLNLVAKSENKVQKSAENTQDSRPEASLRSQKAAILLGK